jgi:hypothetical protein
MSAKIECAWCKKIFKKDNLHEMSYINQQGEEKKILFCKHCKDEIGEFLVKDRSFNFIKKVSK